MFRRGRFQTSDGGLGCSDALGDFGLREPRFGPRSKHLIQERELVIQDVVRGLDARLGQSLALETLQRARYL